VPPVIGVASIIRARFHPDTFARKYYRDSRLPA
jgi:hypothetical protein